MKPQKYAKQFGIPLQEAKKNFQAYHDAFPGVKEFQDRAVAFTKKHGYITTLLGRERPLPFIRCEDSGMQAAAERAAMNCPIQGSAADMIKRAVVDCRRLIRDEGWPVRIVLLVHDEILFTMPIEWAKAHSRTSPGSPILCVMRSPCAFQWYLAPRSSRAGGLNPNWMTSTIPIDLEGD